jgi:PAS domain S-box-containing protein
VKENNNPNYRVSKKTGPSGTAKAAYKTSNTDPRNTEGQIPLNETDYQRIVETMSDGLSVLDSNGVIIYVNDRFCEMLGYLKYEILGRPAAVLLDDKNQIILREQLSKRRKGIAKPYELTITGKNGKLVHTINSPRQILDSSGKIEGSFAVITDITDQKLTVEKLRWESKASAIMAEFANKLLAGIDQIEDTGSLVLKYAKELTGSSHGHVTITGQWEAYSIDKTQDIKKSYYTNAPLKVETSSWTDRPSAPVRSYISVPVIIDKELAGHIALANSSREYTERDLKTIERLAELFAIAIQKHRALDEIQRKTYLSQSIIDAFPCVVMLLRPDREIVATNKAGLSAGAVPGMKCHSSWWQRENACPWCLAPKALESMELQRLIVEANEIVWDAYWIPIEKDLYLHYAFDITEQKKIQEENRNLEEQLFQAQKMESIGRLAGGIAHDFNNILVGIMGFSEILKLKFPDKSTLEGEAVDIILKGAERAAELTKQLLGFARKGKHNPVPLNINRVIKDVANVSEKIFKKNISINYELEEKVNSIIGDIHQIEQVLTNLIINARDAMPEGGDLFFKTENVSVGKKLKNRHPEFIPGQYVKITIRDSGAGIPAEMLPNIFEPFFTTKSEDKGTGLGLATVYGIVKNHNGYIYVTSEQDKGTEFTLYFPVTLNNIKSGPAESVIIRGDACILVVDDEEQVRHLTSTMLQSFGYKVLLASDGSEAVKIFQKNNQTVDLVLLDMVMPGIEGKEVFDKLIKIKPDIKVLLTSGYSRNGEANKLLKEGALGFIQKPFRMEKLSKIVFETINKADVS